LPFTFWLLSSNPSSDPGFLQWNRDVPARHKSMRRRTGLGHAQLWSHP
jgi:hypothetical protein